jgi:hypothetical protein
MFSAGQSCTFAEYASKVFTPHILKYLQDENRVDMVFDRYFSESLKGATRKKRGKGTRRRVTLTDAILGNWARFPRVDENKVELFELFAQQIVKVDPGENKMVSVIIGENVVCNQTYDWSKQSPCNHEEADSHMLLHIADAEQTGHNKILLRTVDSDVLVLVIGFFHLLQQVNCGLVLELTKTFALLKLTALPEHVVLL